MFPAKPARRQLPLAALLLALLSACSHLPDSRIDQPDWQISGKLGIRQPDTRSVVLLFDWQQQGERYLIHLFNSLGRLELTLSGDHHHALAVQANGEHHRADTPEQLLQQLTGWSFPLADSRHWLQGQAAGNEQHSSHNAAGQLDTLVSGDWQVLLDKYQPVDGKPLPHRLQLQHTPMTLTLIVKQHARFQP
ncbi:MAG TPA: lipoprotein insertase outer membrane protein LolB [Pseudomonadales bacterium]